jgi:hypothetical protein
MADFLAVTASNGPALKDTRAVEAILSRFVWDDDLNIELQIDPDTGAPCLCVYGYSWPEAWPLPDGVPAEDFDRYDDEVEDGVEQLLEGVAPHLAGPLCVQAIGWEKCRYPLAACQWCIDPGGTHVTIGGFGPEVTEQTASRTEC